MRLHQGCCCGGPSFNGWEALGSSGLPLRSYRLSGSAGCKFFRTEASDRSEKVMPRVREIATAITLVYVGLTLTCGFLYWLAGMTPFEALVHALTTLSTGGFSTSDNSMGNFSPAAQWVGTAFMLAGGI